MSAEIKGVIFDIDGTLLDSNLAHAQAWEETFKEFGHEVPLEKIKRLIGMGGDKLLPEAVSLEKDSPQGKEMSERRTALFKEKFLPKLRPTPGARDLVSWLKSEGVKLVIATSANKDELDSLLKAANVAEFFEEKTTSSDAKNSKPDPDIIQAALKKLALPTENVVMIGDTPYDVEAATKAGVPTIGLLSGGWSAAELQNAIATFDNPADMLHNLRPKK